MLSHGVQAFKCWCVVGTAIGMVTAVQANAQTVPSTNPDTATPASVTSPAAAPVGPSEQSDSQQGVGDIVVTAQRRSESLQKVPISVSAFDSKALSSNHVTDIQSLPTIAPSLNLQGLNGLPSSANFFIRGVGTTIYGPFVESSVSIVVDDIAMSRPMLGNVKLFDLDAVEVLAGPQGMLFGKNASAGVVNIRTAQPKIGTFEAIGNVTYENVKAADNASFANVQAAVNLPVSSNAALRISGFYNHQDGLVKNIFKDEFYGMNEFGVRAKFLWEPDSHWKLFVSGDYSHANGPGSGVFVLGSAKPGGFADTTSRAAAIIPRPNNLYNASDGVTGDKVDVGGIQASLAYITDGGLTLSNIVGWRKYFDDSDIDVDLTPTDIFNRNHQHRDFWQFSNEFRITSPSGGKLSYQAGIYYLYNHDYFWYAQGGAATGLGLGTGPKVLGVRSDETAWGRNIAGYAQATYEVFPGLRFTAGGRLTHDELNGYTTNNADGALINTGRAYPAEVRNTVKNDNFSYRVGAQYDFTPTIMGYVTYSRGYKGPTLDMNRLIPLEPEIPTAWEAGIKSSLFDRKLVLNVTAYTQTISNFQAQAYLASQFALVALNAGKMRARGIEWQAAARPISELTLRFSGAYNDAKYLSFVGVPCYTGQPTGIGRNLCNTATNSSDATGDQLNLAPKLAFNTSARYEVPVGGELKAFFQADWNHKSSYNFYPLPNPYTQIGAYDTLNFSVGLTTDNGRWTVSAYVKNATDKRIPNYILSFPLTGTYKDTPQGDYLHFFDKSSFRTIGISLGFKL